MRGAGLLLIAACGAKAPAESLDNLQPQPPPTSPSHVVHAVAVRRPAIDISWLLPDFHEELRWPLTGMNHPMLEPQFPVATELAVGVDWQQLCARGVQNRVSATQKELLSYLHGWCDVAKRDVDAACAHLTPLLGSIKGGLRAAVRQDLANILVEQGDANKAEHWLSKHRIRDVQILDLLAANYIELGSEADAFEINRRAIDSDDSASEATKCTRLVKSIAIGLEHDVERPVNTLKAMVVMAKVPDETCERLWNKVSCARDHSWCSGYLDDEGIAPDALELLNAYENWPSGRATATAWWIYADNARQALPTAGAAQLVVTAIEASLAADHVCEGAMAASFNHAVEMVRGVPEGPAFEARLQQIEKACPKPPLPKAAP